jgi:hypothetical protein
MAKCDFASFFHPDVKIRKTFALGALAFLNFTGESIRAVALGGFRSVMVIFPRYFPRDKST